VTEEPAKPQHMRIDMRAVGTPQTLEFARNYWTEDFRVVPLPTDPPRLRGAGDIWVLKSVAAAQDFDIDCRLHRQSDNMPIDTVRCRVITAGRVDGIAEGQLVSLRPGDVVIEASNISYSLDLEDFACDVIGVSVASLGHDRVGDLTFRIIPRTDPVAAMLASSMRSFFEGLMRADIEEAERLARLMFSLLEAQLDMMVESQERSGGEGLQRRRAMLRHIEDKLADPGLDVGALLDTFPTSRAVVYRDFEEFGGVAKYITSRRLVKALGYLVFDAPDRSIREIGQAVGFASQSHFTQSFKRHFGVSPSSARRAFDFDDALSTSDLSEGHSGLLLREMLIKSEHFAS